MIATDTQDVLRGRLGKPGIDIIKGLKIVALETAEIAAMNQNIANGYPDLPMLSVRIRNDTKGCRFCIHFTRDALLVPHRRFIKPG